MVDAGFIYQCCIAPIPSGDNDPLLVLWHGDLDNMYVFKLYVIIHYS